MTRHQPTEEESQESLVAHAAQKAWEARQVYGDGSPGMSLKNFEVLLQDQKFIRYPATLRFDASLLEDGEAAFAQALEEGDPKAGYVIAVHPSLQNDEESAVIAAAYQLVLINYGDIADREAAEHFGSILMGMDLETYYQKMCTITDHLPS